MLVCVWVGGGRGRGTVCRNGMAPYCYPRNILIDVLFHPQIYVTPTPVLNVFQHKTS